MKTTLQFILLAGLLLAGNLAGWGKENPRARKGPTPHARTSATCVPSSSVSELDINNVRAMLMNGGDMWWDLNNNPRYEIPKVVNPAERRYSLFSGALWIGGLDDAGNLQVAAQTYRQNGNDFWPGPLTEMGAVATPASCEEWDHHYKIDRAEIDAFRNAWYQSEAYGTAFNVDDFPNVKKWPGYGRDANGISISMAPFVNVDGNPNDYNPAAGDYPDIRPFPDGGQPDQAVWWVINDKGDVHTESGGLPIGLEIHVMAFAFTTSNAINDMTFYRYRLFNRSNSALNDTYIGQWVDADVGNAADDYVGCDTLRGLGYAFNGDANDDGAFGYGLNPPAVGTDFFLGPEYAPGQPLKMTQFVYYNNTEGLMGNPEVASHFYGYLRGFWKDGSHMTFGGNGYGGSQPTNFMFPDPPGICGGSNSWSEALVGNDPNDRRYIQSAGPFTLQKGQQMDIHVGVVWARKLANGNLGSVCELLSADDLAQALFDARFQLLEGPDAPVTEVDEYDQELVISWDYPDAFSRNNYHESYSQTDPVLVSQGVSDPTFDFQGYMVFQLKDATVSASELFDTDRARLIAQCDLKDNISTIVNRNEAFLAGSPLPIVTDQIMVSGENKGIFHSVRVNEDLFASGTDRRLKNYTTYHFTVIAYAHNDTASDGRKFLQGNRRFENLVGMPHKITFEQVGTVLQSDYADGIPITQLKGIGNGGQFVKLSEASEATILQQYHLLSPTFQGNAAPIVVQVTNPKEVHASDYRVEVHQRLFEGTEDSIMTANGTLLLDSTFIEWNLLENGQVVYSSTYVKRTGNGPAQYRPTPFSGTLRAIPGHGISIGVNNGTAPTTMMANTEDPVIGSQLTFQDPSQAWLTGLSDDDDFDRWNWIAAGSDSTDNGFLLPSVRNAGIFDANAYSEQILEGSWAPFCFARSFNANDSKLWISPGVGINITAQAFSVRPDSMQNLNEIPDVDIVLTSDHSKWSRCVVVETGTAQNLGTGAPIMTAKWATGWNLDGSKDNRPLSEATQGWSYFPGYAVDLTTGRRLNIFFGENTFDRVNHGHDMLFNPTANLGADGSLVGGRHYIYVSNTEYDGCTEIQSVLSCSTFVGSGSQIYFNQDPNYATHKVWQNIAWTGIPLATGTVELETPDQIPTETRISLRVSQPFRDRVANPGNVFTFSTRDYAALVNQTSVAQKSLMSEVRIVPNPYYGHSSYEQSQLQQVAKLTNLPQKCKVRIFTLNGTLIRAYDKEDDEPELRWDLKNHSGVPIASGVYIIHVDGYDLGETVVKFFTIMPQIDLTSF